MRGGDGDGLTVEQQKRFPVRAKLGIYLSLLLRPVGNIVSITPHATKRSDEDGGSRQTACRRHDGCSPRPCRSEQRPTNKPFGVQQELPSNKGDLRAVCDEGIVRLLWLWYIYIYI